jgi:hypothetical protein
VGEEEFTASFSSPVIGGHMRLGDLFERSGLELIFVAIFSYVLSLGKNGIKSFYHRGTETQRGWCGGFSVNLFFIVQVFVNKVLAAHVLDYQLSDLNALCLCAFVVKTFKIIDGNEKPVLRSRGRHVGWEGVLLRLNNNQFISRLRMILASGAELVLRSPDGCCIGGGEAE